MPLTTTQAAGIFRSAGLRCYPVKSKSCTESKIRYTHFPKVFKGKGVKRWKGFSFPRDNWWTENLDSDPSLPSPGHRSFHSTDTLRCPHCHLPITDSSIQKCHRKPLAFFHRNPFLRRYHCILILPRISKLKSQVKFSSESK